MAIYHPFMFLLIALVAIAELGLTAYLVSQYKKNGYPAGEKGAGRFKSLIILFLFNAAWTTFFAVGYVLMILGGSLHIIASIAGSALWLIITAILWGIAAGLFHSTRSGGSCKGEPIISRCRETLTVEALGWTEFGLCGLALVTACIWHRQNKRRAREGYYV